MFCLNSKYSQHWRSQWGYLSIPFFVTFACFTLYQQFSSFCVLILLLPLPCRMSGWLHSVLKLHTRTLLGCYRTEQSNFPLVLASYLCSFHSSISPEATCLLLDQGLPYDSVVICYILWGSGVGRL